MLFEFVKQVARENPDGFTLELEALELVRVGIVVAYEATQNQFSDEGLQTCLEHAINHAGYIGGWKNPEGLYQYDSVRIFYDLKMAMKWGREQNQIAIFDLTNGKEIFL